MLEINIVLLCLNYDSIFNSLFFYRTTYSVYVEDSEFKGIPTRTYQIPSSVFAGKVTNPANECFCMSDDESTCEIDGIFDASHCFHEIPIVFSFPHFLYAKNNSFLFKTVKGLHPNEEKHKAFIKLEPHFGAAIAGAGRLQLSLRLEKYDRFQVLSKIQPRTYVKRLFGRKNII